MNRIVQAILLLLLLLLLLSVEGARCESSRARATWTGAVARGSAECCAYFVVCLPPGTHATRRNIAVAIPLAFNKKLQQHMRPTTFGDVHVARQTVRRRRRPWPRPKRDWHWESARPTYTARRTYIKDTTRRNTRPSADAAAADYKHQRHARRYSTNVNRIHTAVRQKSAAYTHRYSTHASGIRTAI